MAKLKLKGRDLRKLGYPEGTVIGLAINDVQRFFRNSEKATALALLGEVINRPADFTEHEAVGRIAQALVPTPEVPGPAEIPLNESPLAYQVYGAEGIEEGATQQMDVAMQLPVTTGGALMPDAHQGYGLPIGGVLATKNAVIPYGVGVDIGCRMCLTVYDMAPKFIEQNRAKLKTILTENTRFGRDEFEAPTDHEVLDRKLFGEVTLLKNLKDKAWRQIGTSGGGNHFVEFGIAEVTDADNHLGVAPGQYVAVLSHSGSRGMGANIAGHYTKLAKETCRLPKVAQHLAWLDLASEAGQEYWLAMNLAGDYASACHHQIHDRLAAAIGQEAMVRVENHHNFAWKELDAHGNEVVVHRKGATPAGKGVLGVIPGSMTAPGFIVRGKGSVLSLNSASHGAGRVMSRKRAVASLDKKYVKQSLDKANISLIGGGLDEAPMVYKDIHKVMSYQHDLVDVLGTFLPKVVRMDSH